MHGIRLVTERLTFREFEADDWPAVRDYQTDPRYLRFYPTANRSDDDVRDFVATFVRWQDERPRRRYQYALVRRGDSRLIGNCGIRVHDPNKREANIGYELDATFWGRGYATEAARAIVNFGFESLGLHRIVAECITGNTASARVLEKVGFRREGHLRENQWIQGEWCDTFLYAILEREWKERDGG